MVRVAADRSRSIGEVKVPASSTAAFSSEPTPTALPLNCSLGSQKAMRYACGLNESAHDLAAIVDPTGNSSGRSREIDLGVDAVIQVKAMRLLDSFSEDANNLATIINPIGLGLRGVWEIYLGEYSIVQEEAVE